MVSTSLLIVSSRKLLREGLANLLRQHGDVRVAGEADSAESAAKLARALAVDLVVLVTSADVDVTLESVRQVQAAREAARVIVMPMHVQADGLRAMLSAGVRGCLTRDCSSATLIEAIRHIAAGGIFISPDLTPLLMEGGDSDRGRSQRALAPRERDVLRRIALGQNTKTIAADLGVGSKTVETYRRRLMEKLERHSVAELTRYAVSVGLVSL